MHRALQVPVDAAIQPHNRRVVAASRFGGHPVLVYKLVRRRGGIALRHRSSVGHYVHGELRHPVPPDDERKFGRHNRAEHRLVQRRDDCYYHRERKQWLHFLRLQRRVERDHQPPHADDE